MPGDAGVTVVTTLVCFLFFACEAAGASSARHSLRPRFLSGETIMHNSGVDVPRECGGVLLQSMERRGGQWRQLGTPVMAGLVPAMTRETGDALSSSLLPRSGAEAVGRVAHCERSERCAGWGASASEVFARHALPTPHPALRATLPIKVRDKKERAWVARNDVRRDRRGVWELTSLKGERLNTARNKVSG